MHYAKRDYGNIPKELTKADNWVVWGFPGAAARKAPYEPRSVLNGNPRPARAGDKSTWGSYWWAYRCVELGLAEGIGYEFGGGDLYGVDLDKVMDDEGNLTYKARRICEYMDSYTELSPSGKGVHIIVRAPGADIVRHRSAGSCVEIYNSGRYFTFTGDLDIPTAGGFMKRKTIQTRTKELQALHDAEFPVPQPKTCAAQASGYGGTAPALDGIMERDKVLEALWNGSRTHSSESSADLALMNKLAYYCNCDATAMLGAFLSSPFYAQKDEFHRAKWERPDYRINTVMKAISGTAPRLNTQRRDYNAEPEPDDERGEGDGGGR